MSGLTVVGMVAYVQIGLLILGYLFYRSIREVRARIVTIEANHDALAHRCEECFAAPERSAGKPGETRAAASRKFIASDSAKRKAAMEMASQGTDVRTIAETLDMAKPEVRLLLKVQEFRKEQSRVRGIDKTGGLTL